MEKEIKEVYLSLGRDPAKLKLEGKTEEQLAEMLDKLKAIKYSLDLVFSPNPGVELAKEMLRTTFKLKDGK